MDDDDLRRGRPTTHRAFDVPTATRAGFRMVALAVRVLTHGLEVLGADERRRADIALDLLQGAGAGGMIGGQALDLAAEGGTGAVLEIHQRKTGALIAASCTIGARAAGAAPPAVETLRAYGAQLGLAFQIYDDVLDATATSAQLGKTAGKDAARAKSTFVTLASVAEARAEAERHAAQAVDRLREAGLASTVLAELARYIVTRPN
jgi:geranylgeranyl pyrophosphate synthase